MRRCGKQILRDAFDEKQSGIVLRRLDEQRFWHAFWPVAVIQPRMIIYSDINLRTEYKIWHHNIGIVTARYREREVCDKLHSLQHAAPASMCYSYSRHSDAGVG